MSQPDKPRGMEPTSHPQANPPQSNASIEPSQAWDAIEQVWEERRRSENIPVPTPPAPTVASLQELGQVRELSMRLEASLRRALPNCPAASGPLALSQLLQFATLSQRLDLVPVSAPELVQALQARDRALAQLRPNAPAGIPQLTLDDARRCRLTFAKLLQAAQAPSHADAGKPKTGNPANSATGLYRAIVAAGDPEPKASPSASATTTASHDPRPSSPLMHPPAASPTPAPHITPPPSAATQTPTPPQAPVPIPSPAPIAATPSRLAPAPTVESNPEVVSIPGLREKMGDVAPPVTVKLDLAGPKPATPAISVAQAAAALASTVAAEPDETPIALRKPWPQPYDPPTLTSRLGRALPWAAILLLCVGAVFLGQWMLSPEASADSLRKRAQDIAWDFQSIDPADGFEAQIQSALAMLKEAEAQYSAKDLSAAVKSYKTLIKEGERLKERDGQRSAAIAAREELAKSNAPDQRLVEAGQAAFREGRFTQALRLWRGEADPSEWKRKSDIFVASNADPKPFAGSTDAVKSPDPRSRLLPDPEPEPEPVSVPDAKTEIATAEPQPELNPQPQPVEAEVQPPLATAIVSQPRTLTVESTPMSMPSDQPRPAELTSTPRSAEIVSQPRAAAAAKSETKPPEVVASAPSTTPAPASAPMPTVTAEASVPAPAATKRETNPNSKAESVAISDFPDATGAGLVKKGSAEPDPEETKNSEKPVPSPSNSTPAVVNGQPTTPKMPDEPDLPIALNDKPNTDPISAPGDLPKLPDSLDEPVAPAPAVAQAMPKPAAEPTSTESRKSKPETIKPEPPKPEIAKSEAPTPAPSPAPVPSPDTIQRIESAKTKLADLKKRIGPDVPDGQGGLLIKRVEMMEQQAAALTRTDPPRGLEAWENAVKDATTGYRTGTLALAKSLADSSRHSQALTLLVALMNEGVDGPEFRQAFQRSAAQAPAWWLDLAERNLQASRDPSARIAANGVLAAPRLRIGNPQSPESRAALLASANTIVNPLQSAIAIGSIALAEKAAGDRQQATRIFMQALDKVKTRIPNPSADCQNWWRFTELVQMARDLEDPAVWQACVQRSFERRPTLEEMKATFPAMEGSDYDQYWVAMYSLLYGNLNDAIKAAEIASQRPALNADPYLWCAIARTAAAVNDVKIYEACASRAKPLLAIETLPSPRRDECRSILAMAHALADRAEEARALLITTQNPEARSQVALTLLRAEARAGRLDRARAALADVTSPGDRGKAVRILGISYARQGEYPAAFVWVETLPDPGLRAQAIAGVIEALPALVAVK